VELRGFSDVQAAVAEQRAVLDVNHLTARRLVVQGKPPMADYIGAGSRWFFRALGALYLGGLAAGLSLLFTGHFLFAALGFLAAIVLQQVWGGLSVDLLRMVALRDAAFFHLALREGWVSVIEPPTGPGRKTRPVELESDASSGDGGYTAEIEAALAVLAQRPDDAQTRFNLGVTYLLTGEFDKALEESRILTMLDARLAAKLQNLTRLLAN
jgi:predicted lipid-binding transport protein (Tim44 family)